MQIQYIVLSKMQDGLPAFHPFETFRDAQAFAKEEAKRLLAEGPVVIFKPERSYTASIKIEEGEQAL